MSSENGPLFGPDEPAFSLHLTPAQLKVTHTALKVLFDDLGHEEHDVRQVVRQVLDKLPDEHAIRAIDFTAEVGRRSASAGQPESSAERQL